jgi:uncharacterized DUF497 family protein
MQFERNREKASANLKTHRVSFDEAATIFYDPLAATFEDPDAGAPSSYHRLFV